MITNIITNIINNPFRVLGVYSNATIKEITANKGRITAYSKVGKSIEFPSDMVAVMPPLERSLQNVEDAISSINLPLDKLKNSLFWFVNTSPIDDVALKHLQADNIEKALEIFNKKVSFSSLLNTALCSFIYNDNETAIECMSILIHEDEYRNEFIKAICGDTFSISEDELSKLFIDELLTSYDASTLLSLFPASGNDTEYLKALVIQKPIAKINSEIVKAKNCGDSADEEYNAGLLLIKNTKSALATLKKHLSSSDLQYQTTVDALARQILQCGINYFNASDDDDDVDKALVLQGYAQKIAVGKLLKDRCKENVDVLKQRKELEDIGRFIEPITDELKSLGSRSASIYTAKSFVQRCKTHLAIVEGKLGANNELFLKVSSAVVHNALGMLVDVINREQENRVNVIDGTLKSSIDSAVQVINDLKILKMEDQCRTRLNQNERTLRGLQSQLSALNSRLVQQTSSSSNSGGCYIATMVYGDYEHPKVLVLRDFRDNFLQKHYLGRRFIKFYYKHSPKWVEKLKDKKAINNIIRNLLNAFINLYQR